ncbi:peptidase C14 [Mycena maculata]|uniref:Peptidase C14 n=1 Tax=Mycena maculata TaxID=230809 RepID=A0AAD7I387_9AGAR|nr:peptidase C14 [Mycena maculata]
MNPETYSYEPRAAPHHHRHQPALATQKPGMYQPQMTAPESQDFMYSNCTGRRRALCIGINYRGQSHELHGCINDAKQIFDFLVRHAGYRAKDIVMLTDDCPHQRGQPTRQNIIDGMRWLMRDARPHDALFFHYSGHGGQTPNRDGEKVDGFDDVIFPVDFKHQGHIADDELHSIMVRPLPAGCRLTSVFDSCHSGTVLDLPYMYNHHGHLKMQHVNLRRAAPADVISLSGCKDNQTSADTFEGGAAVGAASYAFIEALKMQPNGSYKDLVRNIRTILHPSFSQKPQLGSSHPINTSRAFIM